MNLCTIIFNEQTIYLFIKLNKSISPTSKRATTLEQTVAADVTPSNYISDALSNKLMVYPRFCISLHIPLNQHIFDRLPSVMS